jgi:hypothetical protein
MAEGLVRRARRFAASIGRGRFQNRPPESVFFYTLHKCASSLFSGYVLNNLDGLKKIDYAQLIYGGEIEPDTRLEFERRGYVYGPIRISAGKAGRVGEMLVAPTTENRFIRDKTAVFFVRDPRDILVSSYYSFGYTHDFSPVDSIREQQQARRRDILAVSLDAYVLEHAMEQAGYFEEIHRLSGICRNSTILKYEDMIERFELFANRMTRCLPVDEGVIRQIYERSRPRESEDTSSHRRSGRVGGFRGKLAKETVASLNARLRGVLDKFDYAT